MSVRRFAVDDGAIEEWTDEQGRLHRSDGPAVVEYYSDGRLRAKHWYRHGRRHREGGPALVRYDQTGDLLRAEWFVDGIRHRDDGPAVIVPDGRGEAYIGYYVEGKKIDAMWARVIPIDDKSK